MRLPLTAAVAAVGAVLLVAGCGTEPAGPGKPAPAVSAAAGGTFNDTDVMFLQMLGPHHTQGVAIVKLAADHATRDDIKTLAKAIEVTQADEITRMSGWLQEWQKPASADPNSHAAHGGMPGTSEQEITALRNAKGADFDKRFLNTLIAHQDDAIQIARLEISGGANPAAKAFAKQVDESRTAEIAQMKSYLKQ